MTTTASNSVQTELEKSKTDQEFANDQAQIGLQSNAVDIAAAINAVDLALATDEHTTALSCDLNNGWESFLARPGIAQIHTAVIAAKDGFELVWEHEREYQTGRMFFSFLKDAFIAIAVPILSLVWLALDAIYQRAATKENKTAAAEKLAALKAWAAARFNHEQGAEQLKLPTN